MTDASVTRRALSLGARDATMGWCAKSFAETTIDAIIVHNGVSPINLPIGYYARFQHTAFIPDVIHLGDEIIDAQGQYYLVKDVQQMWWLDQFDGYLCNLIRIDDHADRAATSGTWHLDSESLKTDSRYRHKTYLDTNITATHLKTDGGVTNASYAVMFSGADYPWIYEFSPSYNDLDLIFTIDKGNSTPVNDAYRDPYKTEETVVIRTFAVNKTGVTAVNLLDQAFSEIKDVFSDLSLSAAGVYRGIERTALKPEDIGGVTMYSEEITVRYERANDDYTPTYPTITYGDSQASTYTFPNVTDIRFNDPDSGDAYLLPPGRVGEITQILGMENFEITLTCDLSTEHAARTWKRPQASAPKTDVNAYQVFQEIKFNGKTDADQEYQNLNLGTGVIPVRLTGLLVQNEGDSQTLQLTFRRYSATDGADGAYTAWYGLA